MPAPSDSSTATEPMRRLAPDAWVDRHGGYLYRYALGRVRRQEVAEELVQEALLAAWRGRAKFDGRAGERTWLTAILKRKVIDWLRASVKQRSREGVGHDPWATAQFSPSGKWRTAPTRTADGVPDDEPTREEFWRELLACLDALPLRLRDAFVLRHLEDVPTAEVCRRTKVTANNLWVMLHRARLRLARCLTDHWFEPEESA